MSLNLWSLWHALQSKAPLTRQKKRPVKELICVLQKLERNGE